MFECGHQTPSMALKDEHPRPPGLKLDWQSVGEGAAMERVEMGTPEEDQKTKAKLPRRTIYFASGETMEEFSTDEEEEDIVEKKTVTVDTSQLTWGPYFWFHMWRVTTSTISVCDYMGEKLASFFGITSPKYQYAIDEYYRIKKEQEEEEEEENRLAEQWRSEKNNTLPTTIQQPEASRASFVNVSFDHEPEATLSIAESNKAPSPLPS
ncbi:protein FAM177A1 isoform X1 [Stigmatopora nigra]